MVIFEACLLLAITSRLKLLEFTIVKICSFCHDCRDGGLVKLIFNKNRRFETVSRTSPIYETDFASGPIFHYYFFFVIRFFIFLLLLDDRAFGVTTRYNIILYCYAARSGYII